MLALHGISKSFPGVRALADVSLTFNGGEIHALAGENGAGKTTLTKIIAGVCQADQGEIVFEGTPTRWHSPSHAQRSGVQIVYQELVLFPNLSVAENIFIGQELRGRLGLVSGRRMRNEASRVLGELGVTIDPDIPVAHLSVAEQQMVEIARALVRNVKLLILDEPTAVISGREVTLLFERLRALRKKGVAIIYISHRLDDIFSLADRVSVLKDGALVGSHLTKDVTHEGLISLMVGRDLGHLFPVKRRPLPHRTSVLHAHALSVAGSVRNVSIELFAGEITALAGLVGAGRTELALGIFGGLPLTSGTIVVDGATYGAMRPAQAIALGIGLVTEDRKGQGLAMQLDIAANITAPRLSHFAHRGFLSPAAELSAAHAAIERYQVSSRGPRTPVATLSGGNQQKLLLARWVSVSRRVLILDEPTRGVDVGAKQEIYRLMLELANAGVAVLMISSELPEVVGMADRVLVMREGSIVGTLEGCDISEERIMRLATHTTRSGPLRGDDFNSDEAFAQVPNAVA